MNPEPLLPLRRSQLPILVAVWLGVLACVFSALLPVRAESPATATGTSVLFSIYGADWDTETHPDLVAFNAWAMKTVAARDAATGSAGPDSSDLAAGVRLAVQRRVILTKWLRADPARVLAAGVPAEVRARLPAAILRELETPFAAVGEYHVYAALRAPGGPAVQAKRREIKVDGRTYAAHVYGRRVSMTSKTNLFLHGILLGNEAVLDENVLRVLPTAEVAIETRTATPLGIAATVGGTVAEGGPRLYRFASPQALGQAETRLRALEAHRTPETSNVSEQTALENPDSVSMLPDSVYTTGKQESPRHPRGFLRLPGRSQQRVDRRHAERDRECFQHGGRSLLRPQFL